MGVDYGAKEEAVSAVDYIREQDELEREAKELMPFDPVECTYVRGAIRQPIFACLTCARENESDGVGICYSCSIQCHSTHDVVELFSKRDFACDCGTTRMAKTQKGSCKLRQRKGNDACSRMRTGSSSIDAERYDARSSVSCDADDIPSTSNTYNQNFKGLFCCCNRPYNPQEETGNMIQCYLGISCGEDWFHDECIMGYSVGKGRSSAQAVKQEDEDAELPREKKDGTPDTEALDYFPELDEFDQFVCWKCVSAARTFFEPLEDDKDIIANKLPHFENVNSKSEWEEKLNKYEHLQDKIQVGNKRQRLEESNKFPYSIFLSVNFKSKLSHLVETLPSDSKVLQFLKTHDFLYNDDPVFEPPEEDGSTTGSIFDLGAEALLKLPRDQAIDGLQAYEKISLKLREFLKPFAQKGEVVTEDEVRNFFKSVKD